MKFKGPVETGSVSVAGVEYPAKDGVVDVPDSAAATAAAGLAPHGFVAVPPEADEPPAEKAEAKRPRKPAAE